jgi:hypothetical protein
MNNILGKYIPEAAIDLIEDMIKKYNFQLKIARSRFSKLGDYRPPQGNYKFHRISVNHNLDKYSFLITLLHEIAHLFVWNKFKNKVNPHGPEWKKEFRELLGIFINKNIFPKDIEAAIQKCFFEKPHFSRSLNKLLQEAIQAHFNIPETLKVKDIPDNSVFELKSGRKFLKIEKLRKKYKCKDIISGRLYSVNPFAEIVAYKSS